MAGYIAGAMVIAFTTVYSFLAHKNVTFAGRRDRPSAKLVSKGNGS